MPEMRFTEFPALSVDLRVEISWAASGLMVDYFSYLFIGKIKALKRIFTITLYDVQLQTLFGVFVTACKERFLTAEVSVSHVSCPSEQDRIFQHC